MKSLGEIITAAMADPDVVSRLGHSTFRFDRVYGVQMMDFRAQPVSFVVPVATRNGVELYAADSGAGETAKRVRAAR